MELEEMIKNYKFNISTKLEYIGFCADELELEMLYLFVFICNYILIHLK